MKFYFSVISHKHQDIIIRLGSLRRLSALKQVTVICRDNVVTPKLREYCKKHAIHYCHNTKQHGFSTNNNLNFLEAESLGMEEQDYFILLNPDVHISNQMIKQLLRELELKAYSFSAPNLFLDKRFSRFDDNLRRYPNFKSFIKNYLFNDRATVIDKSSPEQLPKHYWASGAFLIIRASLYRRINGFDEHYYMYCEDIDFCLRAHRAGQDLNFLPEIKAVHYRHRCSQKFLSVAFFRHVFSVLLYHLASRKLRSNKSCLARSKNRENIDTHCAK